MTVIVGVAHKGKVYMGGDRATSDDSCMVPMMQPKVKKNGPFLIGYAGTIGTGQLAQIVDYPNPPSSNLDVYIRTEFIRALKDAFDFFSAGIDVHDTDKGYADILVGVNGCLFEVNTNDWSVIQYDHIAIGVGNSYALGSLYSTRDWESPRHRVREAVNAAIKYSPSCAKPVDIVVG